MKANAHYIITLLNLIHISTVQFVVEVFNVLLGILTFFMGIYFHYCLLQRQ
jgi:hypothetical protein